MAVDQLQLTRSWQPRLYRCRPARPLVLRRKLSVMPEVPPVTTATPVHNAQSTVAAAIRSRLGQKYREWELLILDDGSTDATAEIVAAFRDARLRFVVGVGNLGLAVRLNQAISMAQGRFFARMDADDIAYPLRLEAQVKFLEQHPECDLLGCGAVFFDDSGRLAGRFPLRRTHAEICSNPWRGFYLPHPTWMGRREWFASNKYSEDYRKTQDQDLLLRTFDTSRFACLDNVLLGYRQERRTLSKLLRGRGYFARSVMSEAWRRRAWMAGIAGVAGQVARSVVDLVTVPFGLDRLVRGEDDASLSVAEHEQWQAVWAACVLEKASGTQ